jgi:D-alanine-D-alanine ligase
MKILILTGGNSSERKISLLSAKNVAEALKENGHEIKIHDLKNGYGKIRQLAKDLDLLFPVLHGEEGEGGILHEYIAKIGKPIIGTNNYIGLKKAWYKISFKKFCDKNRILTSKWRIIENPGDIIKFGFPSVVKTSSGGSSREVFILKSKNDLIKQKRKIFKHKDLFVEKYIDGVEVTVAVLNNRALPVLEIVPPENGWFDYKNKYSGQTKEISNAPSLRKITKIKVQKIALDIHKYFNLGSYSRTDFIIDERGKPVVLEINTIPGLTSGSLVPNSVKAAGLTFNQMLEELVKTAQ